MIFRKNGSDGIVTVKYETQDIGKTDHTATEGRDYTRVEGTLTFAHQETEKTIEIPILFREGEEERDDSFMVKLSEVTPDGAKLSKKDAIIINILTDIDSKKRQETLQQLLERMDDEKGMTWGRQFIRACECSP